MIYLDLSATVRNDLKTGIERVARSLLREMVLAPPEGYVVVPVYLSEEGGRWRVRRANRYLSRQPGFAMVPSEDELVVPMRGDFLMALDLFSEGVVAATKAGHYDYWRSVGARIGFLVYDLLPISRPHLFPSWAPAAHEDWIHSIHSASDLLVCISKHVESELKLWLGQRGVDSSDGPRIVTSSLGADIEASLPTKGLPANVPQILEKLAAHPTFLMVGTIEPRKGHLQVIHAFRELWSAGVEVNLVIVGYEGWKPLADEDRRTIPEIVRLIKNAPNLGETLFWLEGISDEYLDLVYGASRCLIAASVDEGFGLPLIEGSRHGLPILARDIPVFREVGGDAVEFFTADEPAGLAMVIARKLETMNRAEAGSNSAGIPWFSWKESAAMLAAQIIEVAAEAQ